MTAYLMFLREGPIRDEDEMETYRQKLRTNPPESSKVIPRILSGATVSLEGNAPESIVSFEFPTADDAKAWYDSAEYRDALPHRQRAGNFRVMIVDGISLEAFMAQEFGEQSE